MALEQVPHKRTTIVPMNPFPRMLPDNIYCFSGAEDSTFTSAPHPDHVHVTEHHQPTNHFLEQCLRAFRMA